MPDLTDIGVYNTLLVPKVAGPFAADLAHILSRIPERYKSAPLAARGWTREHRYELKLPFGPQWAVQQGATVEREGVKLKVM